MKRFASLLAVLLCGTAVQAQDIIGFDVSSFGDIVLKRDQFGGDIKFEAAFGDYNNEPISTYSAKSVFATIGRSVGRLDVATDVQVFPCTAFLVEEDLLMTNHHCVPGILDHPRAGASAIIGVKFIAGYIREGVTDGTRSFLVNPVPVETNKDLDYTLLRIIGEKPGREFGVLRLAARVPEANDPYWIIGHPMGEAQRISREKCRANAPAMSEGRLLHTCDTLPGNSGSPVIDATSQQVIGLHNAGSDRNKINYGIPMSRILQSSSILKAAPGAVDPAPAKPSRETLASRALAAAFALPDDAQVEAGLVKLVKDFPGTSAARAAQRRIDRFERSRTEALKRQKSDEKRKRADEANAAFLAAIVITDIPTKRATLESLIARYPDTPVIGPARAMLAGLKAPEPTQPTIEAGAKLTKPTQRYFLKAGDVLPEGTGVAVVAEPVFNSASSTGEVLGHKKVSVTLGRHVGDGWYRVAGKLGQFVHFPEGTLVHATAAPVAPTTVSKPKPAATASGVHPEGTKFKIGSIALRALPSRSSKTVSYVYGVVTVGAHVKDNWYAVEGRSNRYVQIPDDAEVLKTAATQTAPTSATSKRDTAFPPGTQLKIKSLRVHSAPSSSSRTISYIYGRVTLGRHVRDDWYAVEGDAGRYVKIPAGTQINTAPAAKPVSATVATSAPPGTKTTHGTVLAPGTKLKIKSLPVFTSASTGSSKVSNLFGRVTVGRHIYKNWYTVDRKIGQYVQIPVGTEILSSPVTVRNATGGTYPAGTKVKIKSAATYASPSSTARRVSFVYGQVTVGKHVRGDWYEVQGHSPKRYVELPKDAATPASATATKTDAPLRAGTRLTLNQEIPLYIAPTSGSIWRKTVFGPVTINQVIGDDWYSLYGEQGYVNLTAEILAIAVGR